jgi:hypothetical protein
LRKSEGLLKDAVGKRYEDCRHKRGILNFVGEINKRLLGILDGNDADYYDEQIRTFERNSDDTTDLLKQQICVIKTTLAALNDTLADMGHNDKLVKKGTVLYSDLPGHTILRNRPET